MRHPWGTTLASRLKWARDQRGIGSKALSAKAGLSTATVSSIETGTRKDTTLDTCAALARALGVPEEWLGWGKGEPGI